MARWVMTDQGPMLIPGYSPDGRPCLRCPQPRWKCTRDGCLALPEPEQLEEGAFEVTPVLPVHLEACDPGTWKDGTVRCAPGCPLAPPGRVIPGAE